jgi:hypothetical protein
VFAAMSVCHLLLPMVPVLLCRWTWSPAETWLVVAMNLASVVYL